MVARRFGATLPPAFKKHGRTCLLSPWERFERSGGLLEFRWDADHQTLEGAFDAVPGISRKTIWKKETRLCLLVWWNANRQAGDKLKNDVLAILQKQPSFVDFLMLSDKANPERLLCISLWTSREDSEEYHRQHYETIANVLEPVLKSPPTLKTFTVVASTAYRIARAA